MPTTYHLHSTQFILDILYNISKKLEIFPNHGKFPWLNARTKQINLPTKHYFFFGTNYKYIWIHWIANCYFLHWIFKKIYDHYSHFSQMISSFSDQNDIIQNYCTKFKKVVQKQFINPLTTTISLYLKYLNQNMKILGKWTQQIDICIHYVICEIWSCTLLIYYIIKRTTYLICVSFTLY